jgi:chromosome segregation ATPase
MLEHLKKFLSAKAEPIVAEATQPQEEQSMTTTQEQPVLTAEDNTAELVAQLASQASAFEELQGKFAELTEKYAEAQATLASLESAKEDLVAKAAEAKLAVRKEKLEFAVGTEKAATLLSTLEVLDDAAFDSVVSSMTVNLVKEQSSPAFTESGVTAEASETKPTHFKNYIKTK